MVSHAKQDGSGANKLKHYLKALLRVQAGETDFGLLAACPASFAWGSLLHALGGLQATLITHAAHTAFLFLCSQHNQFAMGPRWLVPLQVEVQHFLVT